MIHDFKENLTDINDEEQVCAHIRKLFRKESYDKSGLVYGMGHAIYTLSDPREVMLKEKARELAQKRGMMEEFRLYELIEKNTPAIFIEEKKINKPICANVDLYSGFVYKMLNLPEELYTPIFAISRIVGWCAHRIEEVISNDKIIRPAYKSIIKSKEYKPLKDR